MTKGGNVNMTVAASLSVNKSDVIPDLVIPAGAAFWEWTSLVSATGTVPAMELPASPVALGLPDGNRASGGFNSGQTVPASANTTTLGALAFGGTVRAANARSFISTGDSILFGQGDVSSVGTKGGSGYIARGLDPQFPLFKIAKGGAAGFNIVNDSAGSKTWWANIMAAITFTDYINEHGGGDLRQAGQTAATVLATQQSLYGILGAGKRIYETTKTPRTDSSDSWTTVAGQNPKTDGGWSELATLNNAIRALPIGVTGVVEAADAGMSARDSSRWKAPPAAALDGVHPRSIMAATLAGSVSAGV